MLGLAMGEREGDRLMMHDSRGELYFRGVDKGGLTHSLSLLLPNIDWAFIIC